MLDKQKHQLVMAQLLQGISSNTAISSSLGFKGGTCSYLFYGLPRFSVDLDFDLLNNEIEIPNIMSEIVKIASKMGEIKESWNKRYTIFTLLSYGIMDHNIKIEINTRDAEPQTKEYYMLQQYLGIPLLIGNKDFLFASKLTALLGRSRLAMRDVFDVHHYAKNIWPINIEYIKKKTGDDLDVYLKRCIEYIEKIPKNAVLTELGELIDNKQKSWVKSHLITDTLFLINSYIASLPKE